MGVLPIMSEKSTKPFTLSRYFLSIQPILERIAPHFDEQIARIMETIYETNPDFIGTPYENDEGLLKAFYLYRNAYILAPIASTENDLPEAESD